MPPSATPGGRDGRDDWPLVGRAEQLERLADAVREGEWRGAVVHGPAGVGKTRLAAELLQVAVAGGRVGTRATASPGAAAVPLGALIHLLPRAALENRFDPAALYADVADALRDEANGRPFVLLVDDLPLLDPTSVALLGQLLDAGVLFLVGTVRSGEPAPAAVAGLWGRADLLRVDLGDLSFEGVDTLLHLVLAGPVHGAAVEEIWRASSGNALFVRELVHGARSAGRLVERRGVWWLTGPLETTERLAEVVEARIRDVPDDVRSVLELLAVWEPVGLPEAEAVAGPAPVEALERLGLLGVKAEGRRQQVSLAHPLYGEVLRDRMATLTRRRLLLDHAARIEGRGARRREDPLRIATARMEGAGTADPGLLTAAARLARYGHDFTRVEHLARAAVAADAGPEATLLLGEALHERGSYEEAELVLAAAGVAADTGDEQLRVQLLAMRVRNLVFGLHRPEDAAAVNRRSFALVTNDESRSELVTDEATILLFSDRPEEALAVVRSLPPDVGLRARVLAATVAAPALAVTGQCEQALAVAATGLREHAELGDQLAIANPGIHYNYRLQALLEAGRLPEAAELAAAGHVAAGRGGPPIGRVWWAYGRAWGDLLSGRPRTARRWLAEAATVCATEGFSGPGRVVLSLLATAAAYLGDAAAASTAVDELDALWPWGYFRAQQELGRAWAAVAAGDADRGRKVLVAAGDMAAASGYRASEAWLLHDVARLGDAGAVAGRLAILAGECEGALVPAYAASSRALAEDHPGQLDEASRRFEQLGLLLHAAEAATAAGLAHQRKGSQKPATASLARAATLAERCEGARTPGLVSTSAVVPLTRREREIAVLAAEGVASKAIAAQLYLSVRTVENHLQNTYTKLGITGRADLADALHPLGDDAHPGR